MNNKFARTKILCTVGPACDTVAKLETLMRAGADVFRVNGAHIKDGEIETWITRVRAASKRCGAHAAVMVDLPGTKTRIGELKPSGSLDLRRGQKVSLVTRQSADKSATGSSTKNGPLIPVRPATFLASIKAGQVILLADGAIELEAVRRQGTMVHAKVVHGGVLTSRKGIHAPGAPAHTPVPTTKDRKLARAALRANVDMLALSFVSGPEDVLRLRSLMKREGKSLVPVVTKIERRVALENLEDIINVSSAVIVARGDLGVEIGPESLPSAQRRILQTARRLGRPAIVATEMLESMITKSRPTRAEAQDVATAFMQGTDAVMLSAETAVGASPARAVRTMNRLLVAAEEDPSARFGHSEPNGLEGPAIVPTRPDHHVVRAAVDLATYTKARAIVVLTREGASAFRLSKERPRSPIYAFTHHDEVCRRVALCWGVRARTVRAKKDTDSTAASVLDELHKERAVRRGDRVVVVMGGKGDPVGTTTLIKSLVV